MELLLTIVCFCLLSAVTVGNTGVEGPCFEFPGDSYLHFTPNNFDNDDSIHYTLTFRTTAYNGILLYARGFQDDDEALFIRGGKLNYHLFNAGPSGLGRHFGGYFESTEDVNTGEWITAHVYRTFPVMDHSQMRERYQTGIVLEKNGQIFSYVDYRRRSNISIQPTIYIGGFREPLSETVGYFQGDIKDIREEKNDHTFEEPSLNYMSKVGRTCLDIPNPV